MFPPLGQKYPDGSTNRAFRTDDAVLDRVADDLGLPASLQASGGNSVSARINNVGQVLAMAIPLGTSSPLPPWNAYLVAPGQTMTSAPNLGTAAGSHNYCNGLNDLGQVVGQVGFSADQPWHAYLKTPGSSLTDLGTLGGLYSEAFGINNSGQVTGSAENAARFPRAFRTAPNSVIQAADDLGSLGGKYIHGRVINDAGQVAGDSSITNESASHLFRTAPNADINPATDDLGTLPGGTQIEPDDINAAGDIVGWGNRTGSSQHAFVVLGSTLYDLNDLIDPSLGITLEVASGINDFGDIVARGVINGGDGNDRAFLLTVPEPATSSLCLSALFALLAARPRRR
jgi:probable HAF family extracellular repeat protein